MAHRFGFASIFVVLLWMVVVKAESITGNVSQDIVVNEIDKPKEICASHVDLSSSKEIAESGDERNMFWFLYEFSASILWSSGVKTETPRHQVAASNNSEVDTEPTPTTAVHDHTRQSPQKIVINKETRSLKFHKIFFILPITMTILLLILTIILIIRRGGKRAKRVRSDSRPPSYEIIVKEERLLNETTAEESPPAYADISFESTDHG